jgi:hypothetical protein
MTALLLVGSEASSTGSGYTVSGGPAGEGSTVFGRFVVRTTVVVASVEVASTGDGNTFF